MIRKNISLVLFLAAFVVTSLAAERPATSGSGAFDRVIDQVIARENENIKALRLYSPVTETYLQEMKPDRELGAVPVDDRYFLGRVSIDKDLQNTLFLKTKESFASRMFHRLPRLHGRMDFNPVGFSYMLMMDGRGLDRTHYKYEYMGREFLGELRCYIVNVSPTKGAGAGRFQGRMWIEDQSYNVVRFNGTFVNSKGSGHYLHFDTWRMNLQPGVWLPSYVYTEESSVPNALPKDIGYKGQVRIWGYNVGRSKPTDTFTEVVVDEKDSVKDQSDAQQDLPPVLAQRSWERQSEDNVIERLERAGLMAKTGDVDKVLNTVVANLMITNNLDIAPEVRCRVLLTSPIESFTVGHTIIISRGMLDVLPDEASLAAVLAHELSHIALAHHVDTRFAFNDQTIFADENTFQRMQFARDSQEETEADRKAMQLLENSPYKDKLSTAGLFLRALDARHTALPHLIRGELGNTLTLNNQLRMSELTRNSPRLEPMKLDQIAALPLGGRIKVDPWSNRIEIVKSRPVALLGAREKMPFEVTPVFPFLTRYADNAASTTAPQQPDATTPDTGDNKQVEAGGAAN